MTNSEIKKKIEGFDFPEWVTYTQAMELIKSMKEQLLIL